MTDRLVQTRIPERVAQWVTERATASGDTVASWLRRLLIREANMQFVRGWVEELRRCDPTVLLPNARPAQYLLELQRELTPTASVFTLLHGEGDPRIIGMPVSQNVLQTQTMWFRSVDANRFVLEGSPKPFKIRKMIFDANASRAQITLEVDEEFPANLS
jgi:hypothetical protein